MGGTEGLPSIFPDALALCNPALTRSLRIDLSNSANTPHIWNIIFPEGVVVSMPFVADGYIQSLQEANQSLGQCVDGLIDEVDRIQAVNEEVLRTAEAMAKIEKRLG